ncbi:MAG: NAD(P)-dependent oxidoreductase [Candidatus Nitrosocaldus sp.]|nr:NAD(P)-dependent oxidoreductase [Candidatus Nitrosocaldus sp.]MDW8275458.1 NAD(P)-dependent oxidoreductase [Candidatus Nitrosocaldus sp.]
MDVLVTGASGFIGVRLVRRLLERGHEVRCLVRRQDAASRLTAMGVRRCAVADITDRDGVMRAVKHITDDIGTYALFHLAALNPLIRDRRLQYAVNIDGVRNVMDAVVCAKGRVSRVVYAQGTGVFGDVHGSVVDEGSPYRPGTWFARLRSDAENLLWEASRRNGFALSVAILGDVYGNGGWFTSILVDGLRRGRLGFMIPGSGDYYRCFVHVDDAVDALALMVEVDYPGDERFIVCDDQPCMFRDFVYYTADMLGVSRPYRVPLWLARLILGSDIIDTLTASVRASNTKVKSMLGLGLRYPDYRMGVRAVMDEVKSVRRG